MCTAAAETAETAIVARLKRLPRAPLRPQPPRDTHRQGAATPTVQRFRHSAQKDFVHTLNADVVVTTSLLIDDDAIALPRPRCHVPAVRRGDCAQ